MKKTLENLWNEYLLEKCAVIDTEEERALLRKTAEKHEIINSMLTKEQSTAIESYIDALCEIHSSFSQKAFLKGCEFAVSFIFEASNFKKA